MRQFPGKKLLTWFKNIYLLRFLLIIVFFGAAGGVQTAHAVGRPLTPSADEKEALAQLKNLVPGEIVFTSKRTGQWGIYRIYADGTHLVRLSAPNVSERRCIFIKDGKELAFESNRSGLVQAWIAKPDLSQARCLSPQGKQEWLQGISRNGRWLLVTTDHTPQGYILRDLVERRDVKVDFSALNAKKGKTDVWLAPDGRRLYFAFWPHGGGQMGRGVFLAQISPDGKVSGGRQVSEGCGLAWSPDSSELLTVRTVHGGSDIWRVKWSGERSRVTSRKNWDYFPAYGPYNQWVAWAASPMDQHDHKTGNYELYIKPMQGGEPVRLTFHSAPDQDPAWRAQRGPVIKPRESAQVRFFEAEAFVHKPGQSRKTSGASGGQAVFLPIQAQKTAVVWGQYSHLPAGDYVARFRLKAFGKDTAGEVEIDVAVAGEVKDYKQLRVAQLDHEWTDLELSFELAREVEDLECRLAALPGGGGVMLDYIEVKPREPGLGDYIGELLYEAFIGWWWG